MIIYNRHKNSIIRKMENSDHKFYLTGSRFFGGFNFNSDWDYFVNDSPAVRVWLSDNDFYIQENDLDTVTYDDRTICAVYARNDIHIQCVSDAMLKYQAQQLLSCHSNLRAMDKTSRKHLWNLALQLVSEDLIR